MDVVEQLDRLQDIERRSELTPTKTENIHGIAFPLVANYFAGKIAIRSPRTDPTHNSLPTWIATVPDANTSLFG